MDSSNRARTLKRLSERLSDSGAKDLAKRHGLGSDSRSRALKDSEAETAAELLAVGLGLRDDPKAAARFVGLQYDSPAQLKRLVKKAREDHKGLIEGQMASVGDLLARAIMLLTVRAIQGVHSIPYNQIGPSLKSLAQAQEILTGGARASYVPLVLELPGVVGKETES